MRLGRSRDETPVSVSYVGARFFSNETRIPRVTERKEEIIEVWEIFAKSFESVRVVVEVSRVFISLVISLQSLESSDHLRSLSKVSLSWVVDFELIKIKEFETWESCSRWFEFRRVCVREGGSKVRPTIAPERISGSRSYRFEASRRYDVERSTCWRDRRCTRSFEVPCYSSLFARSFVRAFSAILDLLECLLKRNLLENGGTTRGSCRVTRQLETRKWRGELCWNVYPRFPLSSPYCDW